MTPVSAEQRIQLARASKRAAGISLLGVVAIFATIGFSAWKLRSLSTQVKAETEEIAGLETKTATLEKQAATLEAERDSVRSELVTLQSGVKVLEALKSRLKKDVEALNTKVEETEAEWKFAEESFQVASQQASDLAQALAAPTHRNFYEDFAKSAPIQTLVRPRASAEEIVDNPDRYNFKLWVEVPKSRQSEIESVAYRFNHPSFVNQVQSSRNPSDGYSVGYNGWGALHRVVITIHLRSGEQREIAFDMAAAINQSAEADVPTKGGRDILQLRIPFKGRSKVPYRGKSKVPVKGARVPTKGAPVQNAGDQP